MIDWSKTVQVAETAQGARKAAFEAIRQRRDQAVASGISVAGIPVPTDEVTQNRIMGAALAAMLDSEYRVQWKADDGLFVTLGAQEVIGLANAIRAHVQACFDHEAELRRTIDSDPDIDTGWPGQSTVRVYPDRADGADFEQTGTGIYRLTGNPALAAGAGSIPAPRGEDGQSLSMISATWADGALTLWVADPDGTPTDIPDGRWITIDI